MQLIAHAGNQGNRPAQQCSRRAAAFPRAGSSARFAERIAPNPLPVEFICVAPGYRQIAPGAPMNDSTLPRRTGGSLGCSDPFL